MFTLFFDPRPPRYKVRFPNREAAVKGFGIILRSGGGEAFGDYTYGVNSERLLELLKKENIPFELVSTKQKGKK